MEDALIFQRKATRAGRKSMFSASWTFQFVGLPHSDVANFSDLRLSDAETASLSESAWRVLQLSWAVATLALVDVYWRMIHPAEKGGITRMTREISLVKHGVGGFFKKYILAINVYRTSSFSMVNHQYITYKFAMFHIYSELTWVDPLNMWTWSELLQDLVAMTRQSYLQIDAAHILTYTIGIYTHMMHMYIYIYMIIYSYLDILGVYIYIHRHRVTPPFVYRSILQFPLWNLGQELYPRLVQPTRA